MHYQMLRSRIGTGTSPIMNIVVIPTPPLVVVVPASPSRSTERVEFNQFVSQGQTSLSFSIHAHSHVGVVDDEPDYCVYVGRPYLF